MPTYDLIKDILVSFDGDPETFLLQTYKVFPGASTHCCMQQSRTTLEVSNYVLALVFLVLPVLIMFSLSMLLKLN